MIKAWDVHTSISADGRNLIAVLHCPDWNERTLVNAMFYSLGANSVPCDGPFGGKIIEDGVTAVISGPTLTVSVPSDDFHLVAPLEVRSESLTRVKWLALYTSDEPGGNSDKDWLAASVHLTVLKEDEA